MKVVWTISMVVFKYRYQERKKPACIIEIMDNSRELKMRAGRRLNEQFNQALQICSSVLFFFYKFDLKNYRLILFLALVLVIPIHSILLTNRLERKKKT